MEHGAKEQEMLRPAAQRARQVVVLVLGLFLCILGVVSLALPVLPGVLIIALGLALLASEFEWARRLGQLARVRLNDARARTPRRPG